jgi:dihydrofolate reductase
MGKLAADISMSLDGFVAGPNPTLERPLGDGGDGLHEWVFPLEAWRKDHGLPGGETNASTKVIEERLAATGAVLMGRRMFSGGAGPWEEDPNAGGWWGDDPPFHVPVFVLTSHPRETVTMKGGTTFTFVTDGIEAALDEVRAAAEDRDVYVSGGASVVQQYLEAGLLDELQVNLAPVLLGGGTRLFESGMAALPALEIAGVVEAPAVTHLKYRVTKRP